MSRRRKSSPPARSLLEVGPLPFADVLARLDRWMYRHRRRMRLALRPGLDAGALADLNCRRAISDELATLLAWHDGQSPEFRGTFADNWCLLSGAEILLLAADLDADPPPSWVSGWLPVARDASDSFLVVDPVTVRAVWSGKDEPTVVAVSLTAWVTGLLTEFEAGLYVEDEERGDYLKREQ